MFRILARRTLKALLATLAALLLLWSVAWLAVPGWLKGQIELQGSERLGRALRVQSVQFEPWSLRLTLQGLTLAAAQAAPQAEPQLRVERLVLDLALASLWQGAPVLDGLLIQAPDLRWTHRGGGRHDLDDVLQRLAGGAPSDPAAPPPAFAVHNIQV
ncbi:MAG: hypothetical protein FGM55_15770, partial [Rhodoferax sp.]|nr:hypothetical protein [Rhodoferax sp.]